jgi:hypothetical protein
VPLGDHVDGSRGVDLVAVVEQDAGPNLHRPLRGIRVGCRSLGSDHRGQRASTGLVEPAVVEGIHHQEAGRERRLGTRRVPTRALGDDADRDLATTRELETCVVGCRDRGHGSNVRFVAGRASTVVVSAAVVAVTAVIGGVIVGGVVVASAAGARHEGEHDEWDQCPLRSFHVVAPSLRPGGHSDLCVAYLEAAA